MTIQEIVKSMGGVSKIKVCEDGRIQMLSPNTWCRRNIDVIKANKAEIIEYVNAANAKAREALEKKLAEQRARMEAADNALLNKMHEDAEELRKQIPEDHVEVAVEKVGDADGWAILKYSVGGVEVNREDVNHIGVASAIRPGAIEAFAEEYVCSIAEDKLEQVKKELNEKAEAETNAEQAKIAERQSRFNEAKETGKPVVIRRWTSDCHSKGLDCSFDINIEWAMPDGTTKTEWSHCY